MKAVYVHKHGGPEVLKILKVPVPEVQESEILVKNTYLGVNFVDTQHRGGLNYPITLPFIPGIEAVGFVWKIGAEVSGFKIGDRVGYAGYMGGNYAEYTVVPQEKLIPIPNGVKDTTAAASLLQGMTALCLTDEVYSIQKNDSILIHGGAGGVGLFLVQMAKNKGAKVFVTVSNEDKAAISKSYGADHIINYVEQDFEKEVLKLSKRHGLDAIYDSVGKNTFDKGLNLLKAKGHMIVFGLSSGPVAPFDINRLSGITGAESKGSLSLTWATLSDHTTSRNELLDLASRLFQQIELNKVKPHIHQILLLKDIVQAHKMLENREVSGKILLAI